MTRDQACASLRRFGKVVVWGLRSFRYKKNTYRYVHETFFHTLRKIGKPVAWVDDRPENQGVVSPGDLVLSSNVCGNNPWTEWLPRREGAYYCLHNFEHVKSPAMLALRASLDPRQHLQLRIYNTATEVRDDVLGAEHWNPITCFSRSSRTLYQVWGTDLLEDEFRAPSVIPTLPVVFWVGSIYGRPGDPGGNMSEITELKSVLKARGLRLVHVMFVPSRVNQGLVRLSRIAPSISGRAQVDIGYLPCRLFKNISYGQLGISNVARAKEFFGDAVVVGSDISALVDQSLALTGRERTAMLAEQQRIIANQTYAHKLANIARSFDMLSVR